jgi:hypothetical protein
MKIFPAVVCALSLVALAACRLDTNPAAGDAGGACAPDSAAPDSAAPDSAAPDSAAPDSAAPDGGGVARTWTCNFSQKPFAPGTIHATNCSDSSLQVDVSYSALESATGDVSVTAVVDVPSSPPAKSSMVMWSAGSVQASHAEDALDDDICRGVTPNPGAWTFTLDKVTGTLTSIYTDADLIAGALTFTTPCTVTPSSP